jgi:hypothetical protein
MHEMNSSTTPASSLDLLYKLTRLGKLDLEQLSWGGKVTASRPEWSKEQVLVTDGIAMKEGRAKRLFIPSSAHLAKSYKTFTPVIYKFS